MEECMRENGNQENEMEKVNISGQTVKYMKENLKKMNVMGMEYFTILMGRNQKVFGEMVKNMEKQHMYGQMELDIMFSTQMERNKERECWKAQKLVWNN